MGTFGEVLLVHDDADAMTGQALGCTPDKPLQMDGAFVDLPDFHCDISTGPYDAHLFFQRAPDHRGPVGQRPVVRECDITQIDPCEPSPQPVVPFVVNDIRERGRGQHQVDAGVGDPWRIPCGADGEAVALRVRHASVPEEIPGPREHDLAKIALGGRQTCALVPATLFRQGRGRLIGRCGLSAEVGGRVARDAKQDGHANPVKNAVRVIAFELRIRRKNTTHRFQFLMCLGMEKCEKVFIFDRFGRKIEGVQPSRDVVERDGCKPGARHHQRNGIDVRTKSDASHERALDGGCAAPEVRIVNGGSDAGKPANHKRREIATKAGVIGSLLQGVASSPIRGPEGIDIITNAINNPFFGRAPLAVISADVPHHVIDVWYCCDGTGEGAPLNCHHARERRDAPDTGSGPHVNRRMLDGGQVPALVARGPVKREEGLGRRRLHGVVCFRWVGHGPRVTARRGPPTSEYGGIAGYHRGADAIMWITVLRKHRSYRELQGGIASADAA